MVRQPMVVVDGIWKAYGKVPVLRGINLTVEQNEVLVIICPSGSGKSTLLKCINFLEQYDRGQVVVAGRLVGKRKIDGRLVREAERHINAIRAQIGMASQGLYLFPHRTVLQNIMMAPMRAFHHSRPQAQRPPKDFLPRSARATRRTPTLSTCSDGRSSALRSHAPSQ